MWPSLTGLAAGHLLSLTDFYLLLLFNSLSLVVFPHYLVSHFVCFSPFQIGTFLLTIAPLLPNLFWFKFRKVQSKRSCRRTYAYVSQLSRAPTYVPVFQIGFPVFFCPQQGKLGHTSFDQHTGQRSSLLSHSRVSHADGLTSDSTYH